MRKNRNSFFAESSYQSYIPNMMNQQPLPQGGQNGPYQTANNYFYGGAMPNNYNTQQMGSDIESRIAKIERQLNRMDYRLSKLENANNILSTEDLDTSNSNMYML